MRYIQLKDFCEAIGTGVRAFNKRMYNRKVRLKPLVLRGDKDGVVQGYEECVALVLARTEQVKYALWRERIFEKINAARGDESELESACNEVEAELSELGVCELNIDVETKIGDNLHGLTDGEPEEDEADSEEDSQNPENSEEDSEEEEDEEAEGEDEDAECECVRPAHVNMFIIGGDISEALAALKENGVL